MGEWLRNIMVLNRDYSKNDVKEMTYKLLEEGRKWQTGQETEVIVFYKPHSKWIYLYDSFVNGAYWTGGYRGAVKTVAEIFNSTAIYNELFDGDELIMAMAGETADLYVYGGEGETQYSQLPFQKMEAEKWRHLIDANFAEFKALIDEPDCYPTEQYHKIAAYFGFDNVLYFCDYDNSDEIDVDHEEKLEEYERIFFF